MNQGGRFNLEACGATDVGMKRRLNEDVFVLDHDSGMYLVADGMGGHAAGEVASRVATDEILRAFKDGPSDADETWPEHWDTDLSATANLIVDSIVAGHHRVTMAMNKDADLKGMGTTVVVAAHQPGDRRLVVCHVGDSRAYRYPGSMNRSKRVSSRRRPPAHTHSRTWSHRRSGATANRRSMCWKTISAMETCTSCVLTG